MIKVKDYMNGTKITFSPDMDIMSAISQLIEYKISGAPVIDQRGNFVGFFSEKDCMKVVLNAKYQGELAGNVSDFMYKHCQTIDAEASIIEVAEIFLNTAFKCLPVTNDNRLVGSITRQNILKALEQIKDHDITTI